MGKKGFKGQCIHYCHLSLALTLFSSCTQLYYQAPSVQIDLDSTLTQAASIPYASSVTGTLTLTNQSKRAVSDLNLSIISPFSVLSTTCTASLAALSSCTYQIKFVSPGEGPTSASAVLNYLDAQGARTVSKTITLNGSALPISILALYPTNGDNWNSYVKNDGAATYGIKDMLAGTDTACAGTEGATGYDAYFSCIHGGDKRKASLTADTACTGITASDSLGAFNWICKVYSSQPYIVSTGLKPTKALKDLLTASGWTSNSVSVSKGGYVIYTSSPSAWWTNSIQELPDNSTSSPQTLSTAGMIYVLTSSRATKGYTLDANGISVTTLNDAVLSYAGSGANFCGANTCILYTSARNRLWIEGNYSAQSNAVSDALISLSNTRHSQVRRANLTGSSAAGQGLRLGGGAAYNRVYQVNIAGIGGGWAMWDYGTTKTLVQSVRILNCLAGIYTQTTYSTYSNLLSTAGLALDNESFNDFHQVSILNWSGMAWDAGGAFNSNNFTFTDIFMVNNLTGFSWLGGGGNSNFNKLAIGNTTNNAINSATTATNVFSGPLVMGGNGTACAGTQGLQLSGGVCINNGTSTATIVNGANFASSIVGQVFTQDSTNSSNSNGSASYSSITDWVDFSNLFRSWGISGGTFPAASQQGPCLTGTCQIWDYRLVNSTSNPVFNTSLNGSTQNAAFTPGAACPAAVQGDVTMTDKMSRVYLINALEITEDGFGNDNGLCESGEACIYAPNFGAYQGEGDYTSQAACSFADGVTASKVQGVTLYAYPVNGVSI